MKSYQSAGLNQLSQSLLTSQVQLQVHMNLFQMWGSSKMVDLLQSQYVQIGLDLNSVYLFLLQQGSAIEVQHLGRINLGQVAEECLDSDKKAALANLAMCEKYLSESRGSRQSMHLVDALFGSESRRILFFEQQIELVRQLGIQNYLTTLVR